MLKNRLVLQPNNHVSCLRLVLINMGLLDELLTGFTLIGLPLVHQQLGLSYTQIGLLFSAGALAGAVIKPPISLLSDRSSKRWWILGGLCGLVIADLLAGKFPIFPVLLCAFALGNPSGGAAVGLSQTALIDSAPQESTRTMTRWMMLSSIGDLLSPLAVTTILTAGLGWTGLCLLSAACWLAAALVILPQRFPRLNHEFSYSRQADEIAADESSPSTESESEVGKDSGPPVGLMQGLRLAMRDTIFLRWVVLDVLTTMLDEIFLTFAVLYMRDVLHAGTLIIGIIVAFQMLAGFLGLFILDRLLARVAPTRLLVIASWLSLAGVIGLLAVHILWFAALSLGVIGLGAACFYPIVSAQAYNRQPGRSGMVRAVTSLGQPFEIVLPGIAGLIAGWFGPLASLGFLGVAPVLFLVIAPKKAGAVSPKNPS
jgi:MFS family permease